MNDEQLAAPDSTAVRVALWRAMHLQVDSPPHVFADEVGARLVAADEDWRRRDDMDPDATSRFRAGHVGWARFVEDLVVERAGYGVGQCVVLGVWTPSRSAGRRWPPDFGCSRSTSLVRKPGSVTGWTSSASVSPTGYGWCRSISRREHRGGNS